MSDPAPYLQTSISTSYAQRYAIVGYTYNTIIILLIVLSPSPRTAACESIRICHLHIRRGVCESRLFFEYYHANHDRYNDNKNGEQTPGDDLPLPRPLELLPSLLQTHPLLGRNRCGKGLRLGIVVGEGVEVVSAESVCVVGVSGVDWLLIPMIAAVFVLLEIDRRVGARSHVRIEGIGGIREAVVATAVVALHLERM